MLLSKETEIKWNNKIKKYYIDKGYFFTKLGDVFKVKVEDLTNGSHAIVKVKCDCQDCESPYLSMYWKEYLRYKKLNDIYYCKECSYKLFGIQKAKKTKLKNSKSFEQWCIENNRQDVLGRWDYELNNCKPNEVFWCSGEKYYFKCPINVHKSTLFQINHFTSSRISLICEGCNSFAQWGVDNLGEDFLEKHWDYEKNNELNINPWKISKGNSYKKVWIKCQEKDYHESYNITCNNFIYGNRCPYCGGRKVHPLDSLGTLYPESLKVWSDKNKKSPYEYSPFSTQKVYWKCPDNIHKDYKRCINNSNTYQFRCPYCQYSRGEERIDKYLNNVGFININNEDYKCIFSTYKYYIPQKTFEGLLGVNKGLLSYDFYIPNNNLLIEYQGEFHDGSVFNQTEEQFKIQQEHDRRKKEYALKNNINLLEIWYYDFDNIEEILNKELNKYNINEE